MKLPVYLATLDRTYPKFPLWTTIDPSSHVMTVPEAVAVFCLHPRRKRPLHQVREAEDLEFIADCDVDHIDAHIA